MFLVSDISSLVMSDFENCTYEVILIMIHMSELTKPYH